MAYPWLAVWSISPTFFEQLFRTKIIRASFRKLGLLFQFALEKLGRFEKHCRNLLVFKRSIFFNRPIAKLVRSPVVDGLKYRLLGGRGGGRQDVSFWILQFRLSSTGFRTRFLNNWSAFHKIVLPLFINLINKLINATPNRHSSPNLN